MDSQFQESLAKEAKVESVSKTIGKISKSGVSVSTTIGNISKSGWLISKSTGKTMKNWSLSFESRSGEPSGNSLGTSVWRPFSLAPTSPSPGGPLFFNFFEIFKMFKIKKKSKPLENRQKWILNLRNRWKTRKCEVSV